MFCKSRKHRLLKCFIINVDKKEGAHLIQKRFQFSSVRNDDPIDKKLEKLAELQQEEEAIEVRIQRSDEEIEEKRREQMNVQVEIEQWEKESQTAKRLLRKYTSSYQLKARMTELEDTLRRNRQVRDELKEKLRHYEEEQEMLQQGKLESPRQQHALEHLKNQQIKAYPLRYFVEMIDDVPIKQEHLFDAIKYTIFYEGDTCQPINDLYHVSLQRTVPERLITSLPRYGITMRSGLSKMEQNQAARVLWWIEQLFLNKSTYIKQGILIDTHGKRGAQERGAFILSERAISQRTKRVNELVNKYVEEIDRLVTYIHEQSECYSAWSADVHKVEEAEALLSQRMDQQYRLEQIKEIADQLVSIQSVKKDFERAYKEVWKKKYAIQREIEVSNSDLGVCERFEVKSIKTQLEKF